MADKSEVLIDIRFDPPSKVDLAPETDEDPLGLADGDEDLDLIEKVRDRLDLDQEISDVTIAASLAQIAARGDQRGRWLAAFGSPLGRHLALRGSDLNTALNMLLGLAPRHQS